jgi:ribosomal protein S17
MVMRKSSGFSHPNYNRGKGNKFIPQIWAWKVLVPLYDRIMAHNPKLETSYEGEIQKIGDTVLFRETYNIAHWGTFHLTDRMHWVTIDKGVYVNCFVRDVIEVQADLNLLDRYCKEFACRAFEEMTIPKGPALFAVQVFKAEMLRIPDSQDKIQMVVGYGFKQLMDPFRRATEIIGKAAAKGKDIKEILVELGAEGF